MTTEVYGEDGYDKAYARDRAERERATARWAESMSRAADIGTNPRETESVRLAAASLAQEMATYAAWQDGNMAVLESPPEQCDRCGEPLKHGGNDGHRCS
jgi:hypothetical protein